MKLTQKDQKSFEKLSRTYFKKLRSLTSESIFEMLTKDNPKLSVFANLKVSHINSNW